TVQTGNFKMGSSSTIYSLDGSTVHFANTNDNLVSIRVRDVSASGKITGGNYTIQGNDIINNANETVNFKGSSGQFMNLSANTIQCGNQRMGSGGTYYSLSGQILYFADRN